MCACEKAQTHLLHLPFQLDALLAWQLACLLLDYTHTIYALHDTRSGPGTWLCKTLASVVTDTININGTFPDSLSCVFRSGVSTYPSLLERRPMGQVPSIGTEKSSGHNIYAVVSYLMTAVTRSVHSPWSSSSGGRVHSMCIASNCICT